MTTVTVTIDLPGNPAVEASVAADVVRWSAAKATQPENAGMEVTVRVDKVDR